MYKNGMKSLFIFAWLIALIIGIVVGLVKWFKCLTCSEATKLIDRYREIQEEYKEYENIMNDLHNEAEQIRETALNDYWIVFTEAWRQKLESVSPDDTSI